MKTREQFLSLSKDELIEYILKKESDFELLDAKFRKLQEDYNNTLKKMNNVIEQNKIQIIRAYTPKTEVDFDTRLFAPIIDPLPITQPFNIVTFIPIQLSPSKITSASLSGSFSLSVMVSTYLPTMSHL